MQKMIRQQHIYLATVLRWLLLFAGRTADYDQAPAVPSMPDHFLHPPAMGKSMTLAGGLDRNGTLEVS